MKNFPHVYKELERCLSVDRLSPYVRRTGGDLALAAQLYRWNSQVSAALFEVISTAEVGLRNVLDAALTRHIVGKGDWIFNPELDALKFNDGTKRKLQNARDHLDSTANAVTHSRLVAELHFGFWLYLLAKNYEATLWTPALRYAFPGLTPARRSDVYRACSELRVIRNRIAHHEPLINRDVMDDYERVVTLIGWFSPELKEWVLQDSRVTELLALRPW